MAGAGDVTRAAREFRDAAIRHEEAARLTIAARYQRVITALRAEAEAVADRIALARERGIPESPAWVYQTERLARLQQQTLAELAEFTRQAPAVVVANAEAAATSAADAAGAYLDRAAPVLDGLRQATMQLPRSALLQAVAVTQVGPLRQLLAAASIDGVEAMQDALAAGIARGANPRVIAREIMWAGGIPGRRALTIARTEVMRAWRESSRATYQQDPAVDGWTWWSALDRRTCASCWAQHGTVHPLGEAMATHPNCRCVALPKTVSFRSLGIDLDDPVVEAGPDLFAALPADTQTDILGPGKAAAYHAGEIRLEDLVEHRTSPAWGPSTSEASLRAARARARARA